MTTTDYRLYQKAKDADKALHDALVAEYGESRAGDMRYRVGELPTHIVALKYAKLSADADWLEEMGK